VKLGSFFLGVIVRQQPSRRKTEPRHKDDIRVGSLVTHKVLCPLLLKLLINDPDDALDLLQIPVNGRLDLFGMERGEPSGLAEVGALAGHLEVEPALAEPFLGEGAVRELAVGVVRLDEVLVDGA
jgi:hypothetical protein